jgi:hypothetical protein
MRKSIALSAPPPLRGYRGEIVTHQRCGVLMAHRRSIDGIGIDGGTEKRRTVTAITSGGRSGL